MEQVRYDAIKTFMNGRDVSASYSDPSHKSEYDFQEFVEVFENEARLKAEQDALNALNNPIDNIHP